MIHNDQQVTPPQRIRPKVTEPQPKPNQVILNGWPVLIKKQDQPDYSPGVTPTPLECFIQSPVIVTILESGRS